MQDPDDRGRHPPTPAPDRGNRVQAPETPPTVGRNPFEKAWSPSQGQPAHLTTSNRRAAGSDPEQAGAKPLDWAAQHSWRSGLIDATSRQSAASEPHAMQRPDTTNGAAMTRSTVVGATEGSCAPQQQRANDTPHSPARDSRQGVLSSRCIDPAGSGARIDATRSHSRSQQGDG